LIQGLRIDKMGGASKLLGHRPAQSFSGTCLVPAYGCAAANVTVRRQVSFVFHFGMAIGLEAVGEMLARYISETPGALRP
jgi:hypothetical protein